MKTTQNRGLTFFRTAGLLAVLVALLLPASASAADSIYWSNEDGSNSIRYGPLSGDNGGSTPAQTLFNDGGRPCGVALNPAAGKAYWANWDSGEIRVGNLDGTSANTLFDDGFVNVCGVAVDPANNKIYWANFSTQQIRVGNLDGTGTASTLFGGESSSLFTALLRKPALTGRPSISGGAKVGRELTCRASFAPDLLGAFLYRAPASVDYQWKKGAAIVASGPTFTPTEAGDYTCTVAATNQVGDTVQTSAVKNVH